MWTIKNLKKLGLVKPHTKLGLEKIKVVEQAILSFSLASNCAHAVETLHSTNGRNCHVFGQPVSATHPHMISDGELVSGVTLKEFQQRRTRLMHAIQKYSRDHLQNERKRNNHVVVIPSSTKKYMSDKIPYSFRQNSNFFYLSGCQEPDTVLVLWIKENNAVLSFLFMRPKDKHAELWEGARTGVDLAVELFGVDQAYSVENFENELRRIVLFEKPLIWHDTESSDLHDVSKIVKRVSCVEIGNTTRLQSPTPIIHGMRLYKSTSEQNLMRRTCQIASKSINEVMAESKPGLSEHHIFAMTDFKCRMRNASHLAYPPVVASGKNATIIHYINNTQLCKSGDLVLMDAGCEYGGYSSDVTRTWPINGKFTDAQKTLYDIVLQLQKDLIGNILSERGETLDQLFDNMCFNLGKYLKEIGLVPKHINDIVGLTRAGYKYCPHHVSHYLGMDVHDTPLMPRSLRLMPGMVFTIEPGIYISQDQSDVPPDFRGIGIRIEDDILITNENTVEVLTSTCVKEINDLENLCKIKS